MQERAQPIKVLPMRFLVNGHAMRPRVLVRGGNSLVEPRYDELNRKVAAWLCRDSETSIIEISDMALVDRASRAGGRKVRFELSQ